MASLILGLSGKKRSGKDTFAARLVDVHGFTRVAFADALKDVALDLDPVIPVEADEVGLVFPGTLHLRETHERLSFIVELLGWEQAKRLREVRRTLQFLGVAVRDHLSESAWIDAAFAVADRVDGPVVITDVRFPNEVAAVRGAGGQVARIERLGLESADPHVSETLLDSVVPDIYVRNDADVDSLHSYADIVARLLLAR